MKALTHTRRNSFTLTEVMVATGTASITMIGFIMCYMSFTKIVAGTMNQLKVQSYARQGMDMITWDVRRAISATIYTSYLGATNADSGAYIMIQFPSNAFSAPYTNKLYHHYYVGSLQGFNNGLTNGRLYYFESASTNTTTFPATSAHREVIRGVSNSDRVFDWINGAVNVNIRVADENDYDGKQIIYLRSAVAFRNRNGEN